MKEQISPVLGKIPSGLFILSVQSDQGQETGMLASWVQQAAFEPPVITVAVNKKRYITDWLQNGSHLALSLVGENQKQFLSHFGKGFDPHAPAFEGLAIDRSPAGLPLLADAFGWLEGTVTSSTDAGDHIVYFVELSAAGRNLALDKEKPYVHIRKNGFGY